MDMIVPRTANKHPSKTNRSLSAGIITFLYVIFASVWIFSTSYFINLGVDDPQLSSQIETIKGILFVLLTGVLLYLTLKIRQPVSIDTIDNELASHVQKSYPSIKRLGIIFTSVILFIPVLAYIVIITEQPRLVERTYDNLRAIAELKTEQIENWIQERHSDGQTLANDPGFVNQVIQLKKGKPIDPSLERRLESFRKAYQYLSLTIIDESGNILQHSGTAQHIDKSNIEELLGNITPGTDHVSMFRDITNSFHLNFLVPLYAENRPATLSGAIIMHMEPEDFLLPYIEKWPTRSYSGENFLIRKHGDSVFFLSKTIGFSSARVPVDNEDTGIAQLSKTALKDNSDGVFKGNDYRNKPVFAAYARVDNTDWMVISKLDQDEVLEPLHTLVKWIAITSFFALIVISLSLLLLWRQQLRIYQLGIMAERAKTDRVLRNFYELPFIGMAITSPHNKRWLQFNDYLCDILGYSREELSNMTWEQLTHPDDRQKNLTEFNQLLAGQKDSYLIECRFVRKDNEIIYIILDAKAVRDKSGEIDYIVTTVQDITRRISSEHHIKQLSRIYATLSKTNEAIVRSKVPDELYTSICQHAVNHGGFKVAWIGTLIRANKEFYVNKYYGILDSHIDNYIQSLNTYNTELFEQFYTTIEAGKPFWCQEITQESACSAWSKLDEDTEINSLAILPLINNGKSTTVFCLYSELANAFDSNIRDLLNEMISDIRFALVIFENEKKRQKAEQRLDLAIQGSSDAPWDWDLTTDEFFYSPQWWNMLGYKENELRPDSTLWRRLAHPDDIDNVDQTIKRIMQPGNERDSVECRLRHKNGHYVPTLIRGIVSRDKFGNATRLTGMVTDLTQRKIIENKLTQAAKVFEQSHEGIIITDTDNKIIMVNNAFTNITGYEEDEALGVTPNFLSSGRHNKSFYKQMWHEINTNGYWQGEIWNKRKDGSIYPEWINITRTTDDKDNLTGYIGIFEDITQRKEYEEHIHWLAHFDTLTGLPNRTLLADRSHNAISIANRNNHHVSILYCDLDHFKNINDALGHDIGDKLLVKAANRILERVRDEDTVSRLGGDEFIIVLPDINANGAATLAHDLLDIVNRPYKIDQYELTISLSIGISVYPDDGTNFEELAKNADIAMYRAKHIGRNNYCFFTPELQQISARTLKLESDIQQALHLEQFLIYYQPQVSLLDGHIVGVEALLRWEHPEFGLIPPLEFISIAEHSGQILAIGEWVTKTALHQLKEWIDIGINPIKVAVNLSVGQLRQPDLFDILKRILTETQLDPELLELEVTESMLMDDQESIIETLNQISNYGIQIAIDDFGTGFSSLSYLKRLPVDFLKIDKAFTQDMLTNPDDAIIARSIITLGHSLGLGVIAEGVETRPQLDFLRIQHCDQMQGYYFSKPLPADEITDILLEADKKTLIIDKQAPANSNKLLVIDDDLGILSTLKLTLQTDGYHILTATSGEQALNLLVMNEISVILVDQHMPGLSGVDFLTKARELSPDSVRILLSGYRDLNTVTDALNYGDIYKFIPKPWDEKLLRESVREALHCYNTTVENRRLMRELKEANKNLLRIRHRDQKK